MRGVQLLSLDSRSFTAVKIQCILICALLSGLFAWAGCSETPETLSDDTTPPTAGEQITFSDIRYNRLTISWGEASDDITPKEKLQYRVLRSSTYININTVRECAEASSDFILRDWAEYVPSLAIEDLTQQTTYWFAVLVRDEKGNMSLYYPQQARTLADDAPRPGTSLVISDRTETSLKVQWGAATDPNYETDVLEYRLVKADSAAKIDTVNEALAVSGSDLVMDWTQNALEKTVTGLSMGTRYYFAVLVRNPKLKAALYSPKMATTIDTKPPTPGDTISFSGIEVDRVTVNWPAATDNLTLQGDLYYKVVWAYTEAEINTVAKANASANVVMNWTRNKLSATATGLTEYTLYYYAVLVKDEQENMALYAPKFVQTRDVHDPIVPEIESGYYVKYSDIQGFSVKITWKQADDPDPGTPTSDLKYRLVWATSPDDIDQDYEIAASNNVVSGYDWVSGSSLSWISDAHTASVGGLSSETVYYFAVGVKDLEGNISVYAPREVKTKDVTPPTPGTLTIDPRDVHSTWVKLTFTEASDTNYLASELEYQVERVSPSAGVLHEWAPYSSYQGVYEVKSLSNNKEYTFVVKVKDPDENIASYTSVAVQTHSSWEPLGVEGFADTSNDDSFALRIIGGVPHVAYLDGADARRQYVTVQKYASDTWQVVGAAGCSGEVAVQVDLEADSSGNPYIGYVAYNGGSPLAKVMMYESSSWSAVPGIPNPTGTVQYVDLAMKGNNPALLLVDKYLDGEQKFAPKVYEYSSSWAEVTGLGNIATGEGAYIVGSLAYSGTVPYVAFNDVAQSNKLSVKKYESASWSSVGSPGFSAEAIMGAHIAFDSALTPYVAYLDFTSNGMVVRVKKYVSSSWVDVGINTGGYATGLSLAISGTTPYVAFSDSTKSYKARVMKFNGSAWEYVEYDATGISAGAINNISIALDTSGKPYIAFRQDNKLTVMVYK